jgi:hypothetical protein
MDIAGFIGIAEKGPVMEPVKIESWAEFLGTFGRKLASAHLAFAVDGFFQNGGRTCWITRLANPKLAKPARRKLYRDGAHVLTLKAITPGEWGNDISIKMTETGAGRFDLVVSLRGVQAEAWRDLSYKQWLEQFNHDEGVPINRHSRLLHLHPGRAFPWTGPEDSQGDASDDKPLLLKMHRTDERAAFIDHPQGAYLKGGVDGLLPGVDIPAHEPETTSLVSPLGVAIADGNVWRRPIPWARLLRDMRAQRLTPTSTGSPSLPLATSVSSPRRRPVLRVHAKTASYHHDHGYLQVVSPSENSPNDENGSFDLLLFQRRDAQKSDVLLERHANLVMNPDDERYVDAVVNAESSLIHVQDLRTHDDWRQNLPAEGEHHLSAPLGIEQFEQAIKSMSDVPEIGMMAIPDLMPTGDETKTKPISRPSRLASSRPIVDRKAGLFDNLDAEEVQKKLVAACEEAGDRIAILDAPNDPMTTDARKNLFERARDLRSRYAALYTPWMEVRDDLIDGRLCAIPPCGHIAGAFARNDRYHGVHKAPANETLEGVVNVTASIDPLSHGDLNTDGINVITASGSRGIRIAGARTLEVGLPWRYLSVTRLFLFVRRGIELQTHWAVFEPNDRALWYALERSAMKVLMQCWANDMLDGRTPRDGFHVRCDETTNTPDQIALGRVVCEIGLRLVAPVEFLVFRIGRGEHGVELVE